MTFIPLNKPSKEIVLDLLNRDNSKSFTFEQVDLTAPQPNVGVNNTATTVVGVVGSRFEGQSVPVTYRRLDLGVLLGPDPLVVDGEFWDVATFLPILNSAGALGLVTTELVPAGMDFTTNELVLTIGDSFAYLPATTVIVKEGFVDFTDTLYQFTTQEFPAMVDPIN